MSLRKENGLSIIKSCNHQIKILIVNTLRSIVSFPPPLKFTVYSVVFSHNEYSTKWIALFPDHDPTNRQLSAYFDTQNPLVDDGHAVISCQSN